MSRIFKLLSCLLVALLLLVLNFKNNLANAEVSDLYSIDGGRVVYDFSTTKQELDWNFYTEFDKYPWIQDEKLFAWTLAEQKMIFRNYVFEDVDVSVDISTINENGKFGAGIYVGANGVSNKMDGLISGYSVSIEHGASNKKYDIKLHHFQNNTWVGAEAEKNGIIYSGDTIRLRVLVKNGILYSFVNDEKNPIIEYEVGNIKGSVGLRCFYSPNTFDNFTVIGNGISLNRELMDELIIKANELKKKNLVAESMNSLDEALVFAISANTQIKVDEAVILLKNSIENAVVKSSIDDLNILINQADRLDNQNGLVYTANSWNSLIAVKNICKSISEENSEWEIAYWYDRLQARIDNLIAYIQEV